MNELVESLRLTFNQKYTDHVADGLYDPRDVDRLMTSQKYAEAFVRHQHGAPKQAADMCHRAFKWRKEFGLNDFSDASFPEELLTKGAIFFRNQDKDENPIMYFKIKEHKKNAATLPLIQKYMVYLLDREDKRLEGRQVVVLFDMTGAGVSNLDLDLIKFLITCFEEYLPDHLAYLLVYDMPWILNAAWKIIRAWLSEEAKKKVMFVRGQEVFEHIDKDNLFLHMGGTDDYQFKYEAVNGVTETNVKEKNVNQNHLSDDDSSSTFTTSTSDTEVRRHVTFSRDDPTVFSSMIVNDFEPEPEPGSPSGKGNFTNNSNHFKIKASSSGKSKAVKSFRDESTFQGTWITIQPGEELVFASTPIQKDPVAYQAVLQLTNPCVRQRTAYKVKTTSPEKYKVRPSLGLIKPGQGAEITVYLAAGQEDVFRDKFLVMAMEVEDGFISSGELGELWRTVPKSKISEHRLRCSLVEPPESPVEMGASTAERLDELQQHIRSLSKRMDSLISTNGELEEQVRGLNRKQKIMIVLLVCFSVLIVATTYHRVASIEHFARNRSTSYFTCLNP